ncbi:hypothetical protein MMMDOFMJ_3537 [Methylobacterium gnaphalii]|uniref:Uncharacterized protein n=1 Tax=Methylobacterium gnaphalii TaxID=1010610 RepID=A0A512JF62_9HYPH|nr:hypothetical protein MGN01_04210 [Methylobacterium gnaphalii]GJD70588.1 hypothetical protein MMMDOFMJ_3537 [Methylobacterium gnaphalii]
MTTATAEARSLVEMIAGPLRLGENVKGALSRVSRATGLPDRRIRGIWHQEARSIRSEEMDRLRQAARDARAMEQARDEFRAVTALIAACDTTAGVWSADGCREADPPMGSRASALDRPLAAGA